MTLVVLTEKLQIFTDTMYNTVYRWKVYNGRPADFFLVPETVYMTTKLVLKYSGK